MNTTGKKSTLQFDFGTNVPMPTAREAVSFFKTQLKLKENEVHSIYRDPEASVLFVKFKDDQFLDHVLHAVGDQVDFTYPDGRKAKVAVTIADGVLKYVRLFNLPPEITDTEIVKALQKYGPVRQVVRERFPADFGFNVFSGIRGVHIEVKTEIPAAIFVGHCKARVFYEGLKNKCFACKQEGHVKSDCPNKSSVQGRLGSNGGAAPQSYAKAVIDGSVHGSDESMEESDSGSEDDSKEETRSNAGEMDTTISPPPELAGGENLPGKINILDREISPVSPSFEPVLPKPSKLDRSKSEEVKRTGSRGRSFTRNSSRRQNLAEEPQDILKALSDSDRDPKRSRSPVVKPGDGKQGTGKKGEGLQGVGTPGMETNGVGTSGEGTSGVGTQKVGIQGTVKKKKGVKKH